MVIFFPKGKRTPSLLKNWIPPFIRRGNRPVISHPRNIMVQPLPSITSPELPPFTSIILWTDSVLQYLILSMVVNKSILYSSIYLLHNHAIKPIKKGSTIIANRGNPIQQIASTIIYCNHVKPPIRANANPQRVPITATVFVRNLIIISISNYFTLSRLL